MKRKYPIGAELTEKGVHFRTWAPKASTLELVIGSSSFPMEKENDGYFSLFVDQAKEGTLYFFRIDGKEQLLPDPASKFQIEGPFGPSSVIDSSGYSWKDHAWKGCKEPVLYEMHVGTFTQEGTWQAAKERLPYLKELGITIIEVMPIADFPGTFGWGYDGVNLFAPTRLYGTPDDLKAFIDEAHLLGIGVILDVVYNHFGPSGNFIEQFSDHYFSKEFKTDWGKAINYTVKEVREFFVTNALYWIQEYHFDGLRFDATQNIYDNSKEHILAEISRTVRKDTKRELYLVAENESQHPIIVKTHGLGIDAVWNDDFHHTSLVKILGRSEAYYQDYTGSAQEIISAIKYGYLYQGQYYSWQKKNRGKPAFDIPLQKFVHYLQNHDQVANSHLSKRFNQIADPALIRLFTTLLLLTPQIPLLFQGQEFGATSPFPFFADHEVEMHRSIWGGRKEFLTQFPSFEDLQGAFQDPCKEETFLMAKINWEEKNNSLFLLHQELLKLRKTYPQFTQPQKIDGSQITPELALFRFFDKGGDDLILFLNFGIDYKVESIADPLFSHPEDKEWKLLLSSASPRFGGLGTPSQKEIPFIIPGHSALVFQLKPTWRENEAEWLL